MSVCIIKNSNHNIGTYEMAVLSTGQNLTISGAVKEKKLQQMKKKTQVVDIYTEQ